MISQEENLVMLSEFLEKADKRILVIYLASTGQLTPDFAFPSSSKNKAVYFIKRHADQVKKDNIKTLLMFGDVSHIPLDQLSNLVESVSLPASDLGPILLTHYLMLIPVLIILNWFLNYYLLFWFLYSGADTDNEQ